MYNKSIIKQQITNDRKQSALNESIIRKFYNDYSFFFKLQKQPILPFEIAQNDISIMLNEITYFSCDAIIHEAISIAIIETPIARQKGVLDSPSPDEMERRKAEFLARQPKDNIFTEEEFKALFPKVDYDKITDLYERGMAYDWDEKFTDAMKCFEQYSSLKSNFMLAKYCKTGRVEISKDIAKSNSIFYEIISSINSKSGLPTPEELCLAGRACLEITPSSFTEKQALKKKAQSFFHEAVKQGYVKASYYSQYYNRLNSDFKPDELIKVANSNDLEAEALAAGMALLYNPAFKSYRSKAENLAIIKKAIQAHLPLAEYILGELFNQAGSRMDDALKPNPELAKFWLKRAANHGDPDAIDLLRQNPTLRPYNR